MFTNKRQPLYGRLSSELSAAQDDTGNQRLSSLFGYCFTERGRLSQTSLLKEQIIKNFNISNRPTES